MRRKVEARQRLKLDRKDPKVNYDRCGLRGWHTDAGRSRR